MGINFYRLTANTEYTLCLEILNTDYQLWHKSQITVDKGTSTGLSIGNVSVRKLSHRYSDSNRNPKFMYYHRIIVNFKKLSSGNKFFLHILVNIPQTGTDLGVYPRQFSGVYMIAYGIMGTVSNIDPDKTYDYHTAFDIRPTEVKYNVDINANQRTIGNIKLDRNDDNKVATNTNVTKVKISNYSSTLTIPAVQYNVNQRWKFTTEDGVLNKLMYSPNFYDFDSEQFHKVMLQEKLNGSFMM